MEYSLGELSPFSKETAVANRLRAFLKESSWDIIQFVSPGGQAVHSLSFTKEGRRRHIFPDVIAWRKSILIVGEIKARQSHSDEKKLLAFLKSHDGTEGVFTTLSRIYGKEVKCEKLIYFLAYEGKPPSAKEEINHLVFIPQNVHPIIVRTTRAEYAWP